jgi:hypothetical protein
MKRSFFTAALILIVAACLGWRSSSRLAAARERNSRALAEAASLGISPDPANPLAKVTVDRQREIRSSLPASEYLVFIKEMEEKRKQGRQSTMSDEESMKRVMAMVERLSSLDADGLTRLMNELQANAELTAETRDNAVMLALTTFADHHPQAALAVFTGSGEALTQASMRRQFVATALGKWAKDDPLGAVKWIQEHHEKYSDVINDDVKNNVIASTASQDPKLAFQLLGDLKFKDNEQAISWIMSAAKTSTERNATLQALREYTANLKDSRKREESLAGCLYMLSGQAMQEGFQQGAQWLDSAKLSATELQSLGSRFSAHDIQSSDTGHWVEWLAKNLPESEATSNQISTMLDNWTQKDYVAAGKWLTATPDGPTKQAAVIGYVDAVASYEPETAAQWAMTLSSGEDRARALKQIYHKWPKNDPAAKAAAEAFADQHGIKR